MNNEFRIRNPRFTLSYTNRYYYISGNLVVSNFLSSLREIPTELVLTQIIECVYICKEVYRDKNSE